MKTLKFKTNIKCAGCIAKVTPLLDEVKGEGGKWEVDIHTPHKTLTVETSDASAEEIEAAVQEAGFKAERV